jgi:hypothetical protein
VSFTAFDAPRDHPYRYRAQRGTAHRKALADALRSIRRSNRPAARLWLKAHRDAVAQVLGFYTGTTNGSSLIDSL